MPRYEFEEDERTFDAVLRNLHVIGEAVAAIPPEVVENHPAIKWKKIAGLRDIVAPQRIGVDRDIVWDAIHDKVPKLGQAVEEILGEG